MPALKASPAGRLGLFVVAVYVLVAAATVQLSSRHVRPLFEGVGPAAPYQWVTPPPELAAGNVRPELTTASVTLGPEISEATTASTPDGQAVVNVDEGAIPVRPGDSSAIITITPVDPASLGPIPAGLAANGNAYRLEFAYQPSGEPVGPLAKEGNVVLTVPHPAETILASADGASWRRLEAQPVGGPTSVGSSFVEPGYYLGAALPSAVLQGSAGTRSKTNVVLLVVGAAVLGAALCGVPVYLRGRREVLANATSARRHRPPARGKGSRRPPPRGKSSRGQPANRPTKKRKR